MATAEQQFKAILDDVARTNALTPDAIRQFDEMMTRVASLETKLGASDKSYADAENGRQKALAESRTLSGELSEVRKQRDALLLEQSAAQKAIWVATFETERRVEMRSIISDLFRNVEVHRAIARTVVVPATPPSASNTYGSPAFAHQAQDHEKQSEG